jgi:CRP/FNR family transcriptional regulator, anaerobic regulatory protein
MTELEHCIKLYFGEVAADDLVCISSFFKLSTLKKGDYLLKEGRKCDKLSFVHGGLLRMFMQTQQKEVTQWISAKGYFATDLSSFHFDIPARLSIQALVDTQIYSISKADYQAIGRQVKHWPEIERMFLVRCFITLEERVLSHLSMTAEERYLQFFKHQPELFNLVPSHYLASLLGMTPETFSRIRKKQLD